MQNLVKAKVDYGVQDFSRSIRSATHALWAGSIDYFSFVDTLVLALHRSLTRAWNEGAKVYGITPDEMTGEEKTALSEQINLNISSIMGFADQIASHTRANGFPLAPLYTRAELWSAQYDAVRSMAMMYAGKDKKLKWVLGACREHCTTCSMLNGRVYRGSTWKKYNIRPRMRSLACKGFRCCCQFIDTNDPCTPGRPPSI